MVRSRNKFVEVAHATQKGKAVAGMTDPPPKWACHTEEITIIPPPLPPPVTKESTPIQPESSTKGDSAAVSISIESLVKNVGVKS